MPVKHKNKERIPLDLEPDLMAHLIATANKVGVKRTTLCRIFIKYGLNNLDAAIDFGDKIHWKPKAVPTIGDSDAPAHNPNHS